MGHLGVRIDERVIDATGYVPGYASHIDTMIDLLENAIHNRSRKVEFEGLLTSPVLVTNSPANMDISFSAFQGFTEDGIYCSVGACYVSHDAAGATLPRIDILCINPAVQKSGVEILTTGIVTAVKGIAAINPTVPDTPSNYLKIKEVTIAAGATTVTLRNWKPMYVKQAMLRPLCQATPDMTIEVNFFRGFIGNTLVETDVQNSPTFTAPATNKCKLDLLCINSSGTLAITQGTEVSLPTEPTAPTYPANKIPICQVYLEGDDAAIYQWQILDVRPSFWIHDQKIRSVIRIPADSLAGDTWERAAFYADVAMKVIDAGIVSDSGFGQASNYAILEVRNKGTDGTGTTSLVSRSFTAINAAAAHCYVSLGTIVNATMAVGEVLAFRKTVSGSGQVVPASMLNLILEKIG